METEHEEEIDLSDISEESLAEVEKRYWFVDTRANAINNLEMMDLFLTQVPDPWKWKWVVIAAHQALYTFLIAALSGTAPLLRVIERDVKKNRKSKKHQIGAAHAWRIEDTSLTEIAQRLSWSGEDGKSGETFSEEDVKKLLKQSPSLIGVQEALARMKKQECLYGSNAIPLQLSSQERRAVERLISEFRNEFEHFQPKSWAIEQDLFPPMIAHVLRVIRFVALESHCIHYNEEGEEERIRAVIEGIQQHLAKIASSGTSQ